MTDRQDEVLSFGLMISVGAAVAAAMGWRTLAGFILGVTTSLAAAAIASCNFD